MTDLNTLTVNDFNPRPAVPVSKPVPPKTAQEAFGKNSQNVTHQHNRLMAALATTESHDYDIWVKFGHALKHEAEKTGQDELFFGLWAWWSKRSHKFQDCDLDAKWVSFKPDGRITVGSILHREPKEGIKFQSLDEFLQTNHEVEYLVEGILAKGQPCIVGAPPKSFKTTLTLYLSLCLAAGAEFLGHKCKKSSVAFVSGESGLAAIQKAIRRQLASMDLKPERFFVTDKLPRFDQPLDAWEEALSELDVDVLVVDPLYLTMDGSNAGNLFEMGHQLKNVADLASRLGITLILIHHFNKAASRDNRPPQLSDLTQAGFSEFTRQWLLLSHREGYEPGAAKLYLNVGGSAGHSDLLHLDIKEDPWCVEANSQAQIVRQKEEEDFKSVVDIICSKIHEPMTKTAMRKACDFTRTQWDKFFPRLLKDEILVVTAKKSKGHPKYAVR